MKVLTVRQLRLKRLQDEQDAARFRWWLARWTADSDVEIDVLNDTLKHAHTPDQVRAAIDSALTKRSRASTTAKE